MDTNVSPETLAAVVRDICGPNGADEATTACIHFWLNAHIVEMRVKLNIPAWWEDAGS